MNEPCRRKQYCDDNALLLYKQISQLVYLDAIVKETLRLHSPAGVARMTAKDINLHLAGDKKTYFIPAGTATFVMLQYTSCRPTSRTTVFRLDRFINHVEKEESLRTCMPFSTSALVIVLAYPWQWLKSRLFFATFCVVTRSVQLRPAAAAVPTLLYIPFQS
jgi:hypothetical protein